MIKCGMCPLQEHCEVGGGYSCDYMLRKKGELPDNATDTCPLYALVMLSYF